MYSARQALSLLLMPPPVGDKDATPKPAIEYFDQLEIYPGELQLPNNIVIIRD